MTTPLPDVLSFGYATYTDYGDGCLVFLFPIVSAVLASFVMFMDVQKTINLT